MTCSSVKETETALYYLQSRYYDPALGRFLNLDAFASTGQGLLGNNMFAYCLNSPVSRKDSSGSFSYRVEEKPEGISLIAKDSKDTITGKYTIVIIFEVSYAEEVALYLEWLDIQMSSTGVDISLPNGNTLSLSYSNTSLDFDSHSVQFIESGVSSHSFVFSEDGWGIESNVSGDGFSFSLTVQYMPNWVTTTLERIGAEISAQMGGLGNGSPRWHDSQTKVKLSYGGKIGCDMFNPTAYMFR